jgi:hypothetical protein
MLLGGAGQGNPTIVQHHRSQQARNASDDGIFRQRSARAATSRFTRPVRGSVITHESHGWQWQRSFRSANTCNKGHEIVQSGTAGIRHLEKDHVATTFLRPRSASQPRFHALQDASTHPAHEPIRRRRASAHGQQKSTGISHSLLPWLLGAVARGTSSVVATERARSSSWPTSAPRVGRGGFSGSRSAPAGVEEKAAAPPPAAWAPDEHVCCHCSRLTDACLTWRAISRGGASATTTPPSPPASAVCDAWFGASRVHACLLIPTCLKNIMASTLRNCPFVKEKKKPYETVQITTNSNPIKNHIDQRGWWYGLPCKSWIKAVLYIKRKPKMAVHTIIHYVIFPRFFYVICPHFLRLVLWYHLKFRITR